MRNVGDPLPRPRRSSGHARRFAAALLAIVLSACSQIGPQTIPRDRFGYGTAVGDSWKRETLLNVVKLRYGDTPVFVEVAQIINQYSLEGQVDLSANFASPDTQRIGGLARYADRPTITYTPLTGQRFTRGILTPIPPVALVYLLRGGWSADLVLRTCVKSINGLASSSGRIAREETLPLFDEVLEILGRVQRSGQVDMRVDEREGGAAAVLFFRRSASPEVAADLSRFKELLGLAPEADEFELVFGNLGENDRQIAMLSRSVLEIMIQFAFEIDVPPEHVAETRAFPGIDHGPAGQARRLIRVHSGPQPAADAFLQVQYRDHWFWIDDRDLRSKRSLLFLNIVFSLVEADVSARGGAVLTVSAGG